LRSTRTGALVAAEAGVAVTYGLNNAQQRGLTFIDAGTLVYEGMIVGAHARDNDLIVNVCKEKKMTNVRASTADIAIKLSPPAHMSLEESLDFIADDEVIDVAPKNIRLRKRILSENKRYRQGRGKIHARTER
jgi:GTP-binding protein